MWFWVGCRCFFKSLSCLGKAKGFYWGQEPLSFRYSQSLVRFLVSFLILALIGRPIKVVEKEFHQRDAFLSCIYQCLDHGLKSAWTTWSQSQEGILCREEPSAEYLPHRMCKLRLRSKTNTPGNSFVYVSILIGILWREYDHAAWESCENTVFTVLHHRATSTKVQKVLKLST